MVDSYDLLGINERKELVYKDVNDDGIVLREDIYAQYDIYLTQNKENYILRLRNLAGEDHSIGMFDPVVLFTEPLPDIFHYTPKSPMHVQVSDCSTRLEYSDKSFSNVVRTVLHVKNENENNDDDDAVKNGTKDKLMAVAFADEQGNPPMCYCAGSAGFDIQFFNKHESHDGPYETCYVCKRGGHDSRCCPDQM